ncbi:MAG: DNA methyltransferase [Akkermansia sp.]
MLIQNDCLIALREIQEGTIDMVYLDPPFFTQKKQVLKNTEGKEYEFSDIWTSRENYLQFIKVRLEEMKRVLKLSGSLFLHCDTSASHYLRILLDEVFGEEQFRSEIIWMYKRWSNSKKGLLSGHQTIFYYSKTDNYKFNTIYTDYSPTTNLDQILQERKRNENGKATYKTDELGHVIYAKEKRGVPTSDVWDIPFLNPKAKERTGYPTQKPIALLEKIIKISTDAGDTVLDPFCGSGTTLVASKLLGREYVGIDLSHEAIKLTERRLVNMIKTESNLLKKGKDSYLTKGEEELSILNQIDCDIVQRNKGIDAFLKKYYHGKPVAIKIQKKDETFMESVHLLSNSAAKKNCIFTILIKQSTNKNDLWGSIPPNMIVLDNYQLQIDEYLSKLIESRYVAKVAESCIH